MFKNVLASIAAAGLVFSPIAAQANTRAMDAGVLIDRAPAAMSGTQTLANDDDDDDDEIGGIYLWLGLLLIGAGVVFAIAGDTSEGDDKFVGNNASPGTGG